MTADLTIEESNKMLRAALSDAVHFIRNRHNMGRGTREERRLSVLANAQEALASEYRETKEEA